MEADVIGVDADPKTGSRTVYVCEVVTHLDGNLYSGEPNTERWTDYTDNDAYQYSLEKLWAKFTNDYQYVSETFPDAENYAFQFWAPAVTGWQRGGDLIDGLEGLAAEFEHEYGESLELIINQDYTKRIEELKEEAEGDTSAYGIPTFRLLQILENLK